ncbi:hypothetical protein ETC01_16290 [Geobacillus sp. NFOSA3]|nr:hypothetical protein [Geobacillus sp. NFOSA3]
MIKRLFLSMLTIMLIFTTFHSSILAEETSNNEIIEEAKELIEDTEVVEIRQDDPLANVFKEYILSKGETIDISGDVFVGVKTGDIITVQFNSSASDTNVTIFEMQYDLNNEKIISVFKIHYDGTSKEITDYETGETEVITEDQECTDCSVSNEEFNEIQDTLQNIEEVAVLQNEIDAILDKQSNTNNENNAENIIFRASAICPKGTYPSQICKNVPAFSISKYLACMLVIKKNRTCRAVASYVKKECVLECIPYT